MSEFLDNGCHMAFASGLLLMGLLWLVLGGPAYRATKKVEGAAKKERL